MLLVRSQSDAARITSLFREEIRLLDPDMPLQNIRTVDELIAIQRWSLRVFGMMFAPSAAAGDQLLCGSRPDRVSIGRGKPQKAAGMMGDRGGASEGPRNEAADLPSTIRPPQD